ncbi:MAG: DegT/DnrJ/EryC1/StrS family aminotransferase [Chitinophagaceae bacterium]|nr:DegT/DnrJ/EryC1/StrS family aminotransferase [Chitinophagaceae bacterium]
MDPYKKKIPITRPSVSTLEIEYVNDAIQTGWGSKCYDYIHRFEKDFAGFQGNQYALATSSCTGAIHLALMALGVKEGDEVIVPDITWIASVEPVLYIGAKPVFVDVLPDTWCIDPAKVAAAITPKTKAVIVVHLYGNLVEMDAIMEIAKKYNLRVLEDAAEGWGSEYKGKKAGSIGDAGVFSFHGTKTISTGEGGMLVTNQKEVFEKAKILNDHGRDPKKGRAFWMENYGYKYKMSNLQAAMGCAQLERAVELIAKKREIFSWYKHELTSRHYMLNPEYPHTKNSYWMPTVLFDESVALDREKLFAYMKEKNIDSRPFFYPLSSLPMFNPCNNAVSYSIYERGINLPSYHDMKYEEAKYVVDTITEFVALNNN